MRRRIAPILALAAVSVALAGCGGNDDSSSPLDDALGYLPEDAPFVFIGSTDFDGDRYRGVREVLERFPLAENLLNQARESIEEEGVSYEDDVEPILGNDFVVGAPTAEDILADDERVILAIKAEDGDKLEELAKKDSKEVGEVDGAKIYEDDDDGDLLAVDDGTAVFAEDRETLEAALEQRGEDDRLREDDVKQALEGLPEDAPAHLYLDIEGLLEGSPDSAEARKIEWVSALRTMGMAFTASQNAIQIDFTVDTEAGSLSDEDLPFASGDGAPAVLAAPNEIGVGIRSANQIVTFIEGALQAVNREGYSQYLTGKRAIGRQIGIDIDRDVLGQLSGDTSVAIGIDGSFAVRSKVADPDALRDTLDKIAEELPSIARQVGAGTVGVATPRGDENFYAVAQPGGGSVVFGVVEDVFVIATDASRAGRLSAEDPTPVEGARGAITFRADAGALAGQVIQRFVSGAEALGASAVTGGLGEARGSAAIDPDGLSGRIVLELK